MSFYQKITEIGKKFIPPHKLFKLGFNVSPMYRRSTAKISSVSEDLLTVKIKLALSYKNRNYVNSIFGGSMFSAVDPIPMVQLIHLLGEAYVIWDKSAAILFKRPAKENLYAIFTYTSEELDHIKNRVAEENEIEIVKTTLLTDKSQTITYCEVRKTIYIANKIYFKAKRKRREQKA